MTSFKILNWRNMTSKSISDSDTDRLATNKKRQKAKEMSRTHDLAISEITSEADEFRVEANKARQQQEKHADLKKASFTQSKPLFDTKSVSEQDSQSQFVDETQGKRKRFNSDDSQQGLNSQTSESSSRRPRKEAKEHKSHVDVISWNANAVDAQNQDGKEQASNDVNQRLMNTMNTIESQMLWVCIERIIWVYSN